MNLFLIGYRGSGKSTVAARLAEIVGWPWLDADAVLEERAGRTIKQIFADGGEAAFRDLEAAVLADLAAGDRRILALGGGAILREANRRILAQRGFTVWLRAAPEVLHERIHADPLTGERRPNLTGMGGLDEIRTLLAQRTPLYEACAQWSVAADTASAEEIAHRIAAALRERKLA
ncbi:MAG: shikimate kinase [Pirellulaceae bacterium]|nr:shikimate kinase [Pirellulaceae bacterium]